MAKYVDLKEAAERLGVSQEELTEMRSRNEISGYRDGGSWKFKAEEVERVLNERGVGGAEHPGSDLLGISDDDGMIDVSDMLDLDDAGGEEGDSILVTEDELGRSDESTSSTIIGKADLNIPSSESDIHLMDEGLSDALSAESGIQLKGGSDLKLDLGDDFEKAPATGTSDVLSADSGLLSLDDLGAGANAPGESSIKLAGDDFSLDDELSLEDSGAASIDLDLDDDLVLSGGSDVTLGSSDSGINLGNPSDSGISLEDVSSDLGSGIDSSLDLGDEMIELEDVDLVGGSDDRTELKSDDQFLLTPVAADPLADEESDDSGSQVIALDDEFEQSAPTLLDSGINQDDSAFEPIEEVGAVAGAAAVGAAATVVDEADFSMWSIVTLGTACACMGIGCLLAMDLIRNIWSWEHPFTLSNTLMDLIVGK